MLAPIRKCQTGCQSGSNQEIPCGNGFSRHHALKNKNKNKNKQEGKGKRKERGSVCDPAPPLLSRSPSEVRHPLGALSIDLFAQIHSKIISSRIRREEGKSMKTFTSTCSPWHDTTSDETIKIESLQVKKLRAKGGGRAKPARKSAVKPAVSPGGGRTVIGQGHLLLFYFWFYFQWKPFLLNWLPQNESNRHALLGCHFRSICCNARLRSEKWNVSFLAF